METTKTEKFSVCFAYYGDGKFLGWYADSFGSIRANGPKVYPYSTEQQKIVYNNFKSKLDGVIKEIAEKVGQSNSVAGNLMTQSESKDQVIFSRYKVVELRMVLCPFYDGPNPDFDQAKYKEWLEKEKAVKGKDFKYSDCPAELSEWISADYSKVKEWASTEPTKFLDLVEVVVKSAHTRTPWIVRKEPIGFSIWSEVKNEGTTETEVVAVLDYRDPEAEPTANRIANCVNAMEGIDDPFKFVEAHKAAIDLIKKEGNDFLKLAKLILKVKADKKMLTDALKDIVEDTQLLEGLFVQGGSPKIKRALEVIEITSKKMSKEELEK